MIWSRGAIFHLWRRNFSEQKGSLRSLTGKIFNFYRWWEKLSFHFELFLNIEPSSEVWEEKLSLGLQIKSSEDFSSTIFLYILTEIKLTWVITTPIMDYDLWTNKDENCNRL